MPTIGQRVPYISTNPNAAQWNNAANILNALRNVSFGTGINGRFTSDGLSLASNNIGGAAPIGFPWGKEWICGLDTTILSATSAFTVEIYNYFPKNAVNHAEMFPNSTQIIPLTTSPSFSDFNSEGRGVLCLTNNSNLVIIPSWNDDYYATYEPLYVLQARGDSTVTDVDVALDIIHGSQKDPPLQGFVRLYRGSDTGTYTRGGWTFISGFVTDPVTLEILGYSVTTTGTSDDLIAVLLDDLPNPYNSEVPIDLPVRDRTDYVLGSINTAIPFHMSGDPYLVPTSTNSLIWTSMNEAVLQSILNKVVKTDTETFQVRNIWKSLGNMAYKIEAPLGMGVMFTKTDNIISLQGTLPETVGDKQIAYTYLGEDEFAWSEIKGVSGGDMTIGSDSPSISISTSPDMTFVALVNDDTDSSGVYYAHDGFRYFMPIAVSGSMSTNEGTELSLEGDTTLPTVSGDYLYTVTNTPASANVWKWDKKATLVLPIEEVTSSTTKELRLQTVNDEGIPTSVGFYSYIAKRSVANGTIEFRWSPMAVIEV